VEDDPSLPLAVPLPSAIEAGVFGWAIDGAHEPDREQVRALTEEHASEMVAILAGIQWLLRCQEAGCDPRSGRPPRTARGREALAAINKEITGLTKRYQGLLDAYSEGFGDAAAEALDAYLRERRVSALPPLEQSEGTPDDGKRQQELFATE